MAAVSLLDNVWTLDKKGFCFVACALCWAFFYYSLWLLFSCFNIRNKSYLNSSVLTSESIRRDWRALIFLQNTEHSWLPLKLIGGAIAPCAQKSIRPSVVVSTLRPQQSCVVGDWQPWELSSGAVMQQRSDVSYQRLNPRRSHAPGE